MKKFSYFIMSFLLIFCVFIFTGCSDKLVTKYYLNQNGELIVEFDNNTTENLGEWNSTIVNSLGSVGINASGYYVINGVATDIIVVYDTVTISNDGYYIVNGIKTNISVNYQTITISDDGYYVVNGIKTSVVATRYYTVNFVTGFETNIQSQRIEEGHRVTRPEIKRKGYTFDGWYCNDELWIFNSDTVLDNITLTAKWTANHYKVSYVNEKGENPQTMDVEFDDEFILPTPSDVEGYTFEGWYNGSELISNGTWKLDENVELTAKWTAKKFTITLNPGDGSVDKITVEVTYDQNYSLPVATNSYGAFIGWFIGDTAVTDAEGNSLGVWNYNENKTLTTTWKIYLNSVDDLDNLYQFKNAYFELERDIDLSGIEWTPVGTEYEPFTGTFDGKNYTISNLTISYFTTNVYDYSLFGYTSGATFKNIRVDNVSIKMIVVENVYVAAISGRNTKIASSFENITTSGVIDITTQGVAILSMAAGICATSPFMNATYCTNNIDIEGCYYIGGIYAYCNGTYQANHLINNGEVESFGVGGGILGYSENRTTITIDNSKNNGDICALYKAGGIIGTALSTTIRTSCNTGLIEVRDTSSNETGAGGIIGMHGGDLVIQNCYNSGRVCSSKSAGGICGGQIISTISSGTISTTISCVYNSGEISGKYYVSGLMGLTVWQTTIFNSCNFGTIYGTSSSETFGYINIGSVSRCYYTVSALNSSQGTQVNEGYSAALYNDLLFWDIKTETNDGIWVLNDSSYPTLAWEFE